MATQIFQRDIDYQVHEDMTMPETAITIEQAALEILDGVEAGRGILPITDFGRAMYENIRSDPAQNDAVMREMATQRRQAFIAQGLLDR